jgi:glucose-6-phosphate isomerase
MTISLDTKMFAPEGSELIGKAESLVTQTLDCLLDIKDRKCKGSEYVGWYDFPELRGNKLVKEVSEYVDGIKVFYDTVIVIGIGGSYLGTRAVADALSHEYQMLLNNDSNNKRPLMLYTGHHLSEAGMVELLDVLDSRQPIVNMISKSGTTTEPGVAFRVIRNYIEKRFGKEEASKRIIATTDSEKGALRKLADQQGYKTFEVPDDVGGRFSVLTAVGLVPLALGGYDIKAMMKGADSVFKSLQKTDELENHPLIKYVTHRSAAYNDGKQIEILSTAEPKMRNTIEWWKQLFGESEGKDGKGMFPAGLTFTTDLHSLGQYVQDGVRSMMETFLSIGDARSRDERNVERRLSVPAAGEDLDGLDYIKGKFISEINDAAMVGTRLAHAEGGVPCLNLHLDRLDESGMGELFAFFEVACGLSAGLLGVNPYDQPGVEAYKKNLFGLLGKPGYEEIGLGLREKV